MTTILRSRLFWLGMVLRLLALPFFGSHDTHSLFIPFLDQAALHPLSNPWAAMSPESFPYGSVLYAVLLLPKWLAYQCVGAATMGSEPLSLSLFKLPMLAFDMVILRHLIHLAPHRHTSIYIYCWLNPILFFTSYVYVQLDVAATALCLSALCALANDKVRTSAMLMALATLKATIMERPKEFGLDHYFFLDTTAPTLLRWLNQGLGKHLSVRMSANGSSEAITPWFKLAGVTNPGWLWVDCFGGKPLPPHVISAARAHAKLCLVSPELQNQPLETIKHFMHFIPTVDAICTKNPRFRQQTQLSPGS